MSTVAVVTRDPDILDTLRELIPTATHHYSWITAGAAPLTADLLLIGWDETEVCPYRLLEDAVMVMAGPIHSGMAKACSEAGIPYAVDVTTEDGQGWLKRRVSALSPRPV